MKKKDDMVLSESYIATVSAEFEGRIYEPGEILSVEEGIEVPIGFMPMILKGTKGEIPTGPYFFCLKECSRNGRTYKPGQLWDRYYFKQQPPEGLFAPLEDKEQYELFTVFHNIREYRLKPEIE